MIIDTENPPPGIGGFLWYEEGDGLRGVVAIDRAKNITLVNDRWCASRVEIEGGVVYCHRLDSPSPPIPDNIVRGTE